MPYHQSLSALTPVTATCSRRLHKAKVWLSRPRSRPARGLRRPDAWWAPESQLAVLVRLLFEHAFRASVGASPVQHSLVAIRCRFHAHHPIPRAAPLACSHCSTARCPPSAASAHVHSSHGQPLTCGHCSTARCPRRAATMQVYPSHGQPLARSHCSTARCPPRAAQANVSASHGPPLACSHCSTTRCPPSAANAHVHSSHGQPSGHAASAAQPGAHPQRQPSWCTHPTGSG
jgi:hypothetical protein